MTPDTDNPSSANEELGPRSATQAMMLVVLRQFTKAGGLAAPDVQ